MSDSLPDLEPAADAEETRDAVSAQKPQEQPEVSARQQPRPTVVTTASTPLEPRPTVSSVASPRPAVVTAMPATVDPVVVLKAVADPVRYKVLQALAGGEVLSVIALAKQLNVHPDTMGKHIKSLRRAQILRRVSQQDGDGRSKYLQLAKGCVRGMEDGRRVLDFGSCVLRLA